ncbi:Uncharacterized protein PBTT_09732 [Plasmodiophora brassicae]
MSGRGGSRGDRGRGRGRGGAAPRARRVQQSTAAQVDHVIVDRPVPEVVLHQQRVPDESTHEVVSRPAKRARHPENDARKKLTMAPKPFLPCKCTTLKCDDFITADMVHAERLEYTKLRAFEKQHAHLTARMRCSKVADSVSYRFTYWFRAQEDNVEQQICRQMFQHVYGFSKKKMDTTRARMTGRHHDPFEVPGDVIGGSDRRGASSVVVRNRIDPEVLDQVREEAFLIIKQHGTPSHYQSRHAKATISLPASFTVRVIWLKVLKKIDLEYTRQYELSLAAGAPVAAIPVISLRRFEDLWRNEFGYAKRQARRVAGDADE